MPNIKSAIERVRIAERNRIRNNAVKSRVKTAIRHLKDEMSGSKDSAKLTELLSNCYSEIDYAVSKGVFHKNMAARKKSRLTRNCNKVTKQA